MVMYKPALTVLVIAMLLMSGCAKNPKYFKSADFYYESDKKKESARRRGL